MLNQASSLLLITLHKEWSFPLRISSVNVTKSAVSCGFGHIYWRKSQWKTSYFVQCYISAFPRRGWWAFSSITNTKKEKVTKKVRNKSYYHLERNVRQKLKMFLYMLLKTFFANYFFYIVNRYTEINLLMSAKETFQTDQLNGYMIVTNYQTVISMQYWKHKLALIISTANSISLLWHRIPKYFAKTSLSRKQGQLWTFLGF